LLQRGGVWFNIPSSSPEQFIRDTLTALHLPPELDRQVLIQQTLLREATTSTAIGYGIALPHPATMVLSDEADAMIALAYPRYSLQWGTDPVESVRAAFFILSANRHAHLSALSAVASLCGAESFRALLYKQADQEEILKAVWQLTKPKVATSV